MHTILTILLAALPLFAQATPEITAIRCPNDGIQPQAALDSTGKIHLIYLSGPDAASDIFYTISTDARTWSKPRRVNSQASAAMAIGTIRGPHLSLGKNNRPHVAWMGSDSAEPRGNDDTAPMLYTRLNDAGDAFEPQRNLIASHPGLDGGGSVAADSTGNVAVVWHAPAIGKKGEENRSVWAVFSTDDGKTFGPDAALVDEPTGACGCCGLRSIFDAKGNLITLYRSANSESRDLTLAIHSKTTLTTTRLQSWPTKACPMSTAALTRADDKTFGAWETQGQIFLAQIDPAAKAQPAPVSPPGKGNNRKHPTLATDSAANLLLAWTEGTAWKKGGTVHWQLFDPTLKPIAEVAGTARSSPVWSLPTIVYANKIFFVIY